MCQLPRRCLRVWLPDRFCRTGSFAMRLRLQRRTALPLRRVADLIPTKKKTQVEAMSLRLTPTDRDVGRPFEGLSKK